LIGVFHAVAIGQAQPVRHGGQSLVDFSDSLRSLTAQTSGSVVQILTSGYGLVADQEDVGASFLAGQSGKGSGVILSADGFIMTNAHVVDGVKHIRVRLHSGTENTRLIDAKLAGLDRTSDLALLRIDAKGLVPLSLADSDSVTQGELVLALGSPLGLENSVSMGVISSVARQISPDDPRIYIQTDAPINPGNSGGPLIDVNGNLVGLNTFIYSKSGGSEGVGFAIPSNVIRYVFNQFLKDGHVHRGQLGIFARTITEPLAEGLDLAPYHGVLIEDMNPDGPAATIGVRIGDVMLSIDGKDLRSVRDLALNLYRHSIGDTVRLEILRGKETVMVDVPVVEREDDPERLADLVDPERDIIEPLGLLAIDVTDAVKKIVGGLRLEGGILVAARAGTSRYVGVDLQQGDVIHEINGHRVNTVAELRLQLQALKPGSVVVLQAERDGKLQYLVLESD
jgi:serine protease Do